MLRKWIPLFLLVLLVACGGNDHAMEETAGELTVSHVRANMTLPSETGSVWLTIHNGTDTDDALVGAELPGCGSVELHNMFMEEGVMVMREVEGGEIPIPAGETVELARGGLHIMCLQKEAPLDAGATVAVTLHFQNAGDMTIDAEVVTPDDEGMDMDSMDMDHEEMEGMDDN